MKISIEPAAKLLDISAHLLRWRIVHQRALKLATRTPRQTVLLCDKLTNFLNRSWWVLRPDLLFLLDDVTNPAVKNQIIEAWSAKEVTFDPTTPKPDVVLKGKGFLKKLPDNVTYDKTDRVMLDLPALESLAGPVARFLDDPYASMPMLALGSGSMLRLSERTATTRQ